MNLRTTEYTNQPSPPKNDEIHHPDHYTWKGTECKKVIEMMMSFELEPDEEKPPTAATEDGQTGKSLENEYPSLF